MLFLLFFFYFFLFFLNEKILVLNYFSSSPISLLKCFQFDSETFIPRFGAHCELCSEGFYAPSSKHHCLPCSCNPIGHFMPKFTYIYTHNFIVIHKKLHSIFLYRISHLLILLPPAHNPIFRPNQALKTLNVTWTADARVSRVLQARSAINVCLTSTSLLLRGVGRLFLIIYY